MAKQPGWYSNRHKTAEAHNDWRARRDARVVVWEETMRENERARAKRTPQQQITVLDERLGKGKGAVKERKRLKAQIERAKKPKRKKK